MRDDEQQPETDDASDERPVRKPWAPPRLVPLDVSATEAQIDDLVVIGS